MSDTMNPSTPAEPPSQRKRRILLVDDDPFLTGLLRMNLEDVGNYEVREENVSLRALDSIQEFLPDLILLDVMMPDLDGADIFYRLKNDQHLKHMVVVFHTATVRSSELSAQGGLINGYPFLPKPSSVTKVVECIETHLANALPAATS